MLHVLLVFLLVCVNQRHCVCLHHGLPLCTPACLGESRSWKGAIDDPTGDYFALSQCNCTSGVGSASGPSGCAQWTCTTHRLSYVHIDIGWALGTSALETLVFRPHPPYPRFALERSNPAASS